MELDTKALDEILLKQIYDTQGETWTRQQLDVIADKEYRKRRRKHEQEQYYFYIIGSKRPYRNTDEMLNAKQLKLIPLYIQKKNIFLKGSGKIDIDYLCKLAGPCLEELIEDFTNK